MWSRIDNIDWEFVFMGVVVGVIALILIAVVTLAIASIPYGASHTPTPTPNLQPTIEYLSTQIAIIKGR